MSADDVAREAIAEVRAKVGRRRGESAQAVKYDLDMWEHARCRGMHSRHFFPEFGENYRGDKEYPYDEDVRDVCRSCPLRVACAGYAAAADELGLWGDTTAHDRSRDGHRLDILGAAGIRFGA